MQEKSLPSPLVIVRGAGDISTGTIHRLFKAGFDVLVLETERPSAIRRRVAFSEAVYDGAATVEGVTATRIADTGEISATLARGEVPLLVDPSGESIRLLRPAAVVDAILAKRNLGTSMDMAPLTVALGPGFMAGRDVRYVIETMRGHDLGRIIASGSATPNTGVPGMIGGYGAERVIHAPAAGVFRLLRDRSDEWFLVMAGSGKDEQDIARYSAALNLSDRVCFTGLIKDRDLLRGLYLASDLLFFPSVFDNAPLVLREAAVLGVPTLAVEGSNAAGAIRKNVSGFTAAATPEAMRDEIIRIFGTGNIREIGKNAQAMIPVSWEKLIPMALERYRTVIERYGKTR